MPEIQIVLKPLVLSELNPPLNVTLVQDTIGLSKLREFLAAQEDKVIGVDTETNCVSDWWFRRIRTIQVGNRAEQYVIDILAFAKSEENLVATQGNYGATNGDVYKELKEILEPVLCTADFVKCGVNLAFDYETIRWNLGLRMWHVFDCSLAERVLQAGTLSLKQYSNFSMASMAARYFDFEINKELQASFDLRSPLTKEQTDYAAFDTRIVLAIRQAQMNVLTKDQLLTVSTIENEALPAFTDMTLNGQRLDTAKWMLRVDHAIVKHAEELKMLDEFFIPIVGKRDEQLDEVELQRLEAIWRTGFEISTPQEMELAAQKRLQKDKAKKTELGLLLKAEEAKRKAAKAEARKAYSTLSKKHTEVKKNIEKCPGAAYLNYKSQPQLLEALHRLPGMKNIADVSDDTLLRFNDRPIIQTLRKYRANGKTIGTYGSAWCQRWVTKPCKEQGWLHPGDGRLHCIFGQLNAETGRTSSSKPNAQNLPAEEEVRSCFVSDPPDNEFSDGYSIITVDLEGAELRILAELSGAQSWLRAFASGQDLHSVCCEILYQDRWASLALPDCAYFEKGENGEPKRQKCSCLEHKKLRGETKSTNFLLVYGGGPSALASAIDSSLDRAKELMQNHEKAFPDIWNFLYTLGKRGKEQKEARSLFGRRRSFTDPTYESAKEWVKSNEEEKLELDEAACEANLFQFKTQSLREPNEKEKWSLTHRSPTDREIRHGMAAMMGSIERQSKNHPMQATNADIVKRAMGSGADAEGKQYLWHTLPKFHAKLLSMVHDEIQVQAPTIYAQQVAELVQDALRRAGAEVCKSVAMTSEYHISNCWEK
jgi:DNA polymerase I-like protein with 3'-5' exonuclease and polymerase domains